MIFLRLLAVILSALALGAHFYRANSLFFAVISVLILPLLFYRRPWVARLTQVFLVFGALEWVRTVFSLIAQRNALGIAWLRMAVILGGIALFTGVSALIFNFSRAIKERYGLE
jgi:hypothetical protein